MSAVMVDWPVNVTATARALGTTRETLRYRIQKYALRADKR